MDAGGSRGVKRCHVAVAEENKDIFSNDDMAIEILSRLSIESIWELKCVSKRWCEICSCPSFRNAHSQRSAKIGGLFIQATVNCFCCGKQYDFTAVHYAPIGKEGPYETTKNILDFLPKKVVVVASSHGVLFCRKIFEEYNAAHINNRKWIKVDRRHVVLYVCNPVTKELMTLKPKGKFRNDCCFGFAYNPP
ncbi:hypothetical protein AQUCO_07700057v1, partial [Aquilegia coerulea]